MYSVHMYSRVRSNLGICRLSTNQSSTMGQKQSKKNIKDDQQGAAHKNTVIIKNRDAKFTASSTTSAGHSFLTIAPAADDDNNSLADEGEGRLLVPRRSFNICGTFLDALTITAPVDDPMERDLAIFELFNVDDPEDTQQLWAYIARPEAHTKDAKESFAAFYEILSRMDHDAENSENFPLHLVSGRLKRLFFGLGQCQQGEHDPVWKGRLAMIVSLPSHGVFLSALLALSPTGTTWTWLALVVGLGLLKALNALHERGYIHRYVTPWNFLLLTPFSADDIIKRTIHVDLSLATKWPMKDKPLGFVGTLKYSSKRASTRHCQGPADDFLSVIFIVAELISGRLPWRAVKDIDECARMKQKFPEYVQYRRLPKEIRRIYHSLYRTYGNKRPDYEAVKMAFEMALNRKASDWDTRDLPDWLGLHVE